MSAWALFGREKAAGKRRRRCLSAPDVAFLQHPSRQSVLEATPAPGQQAANQYVLPHESKNLLSLIATGDSRDVHTA